MKNIIKIALLLCIASMAFAVYGQNSRTTDEGVVINGIRWATRNVDKPGTFTEKPEDAGMFYQWNRKVGWSSTDPLGNSDGGTTWNDSEPEGESWRKENDPCPAGWRVPTHEELQSLADETYVAREWTTENGIHGYRFTDKATGNTLFLPAAGYYYNSSALNYAGPDGYYWSSSVIGTNVYSLYFYSGAVDPNYYDYRAYGFSLRCVAE